MGHAVLHGLEAQLVAVGARGVAKRRVDHERDVPGGDHVAHVALALVDLPHLLALHAGRPQRAGRAACGHDAKAQTRDVASDGHDGALVAVAHADEHRAALGQRVADGQLRLRERRREVARDAHDLAGGLHLGAEHRVGAGEAAEGHDGFLHAEMLEPAVVGRHP